MGNIMKRYVENCFSYGAVKWNGTNTEEILDYMNYSPDGVLYDYFLSESNRPTVPFMHYTSEDGKLVVTQKRSPEKTYELIIEPNGYLVQLGSGIFTSYGSDFEENFMEVAGGWEI